MANLTNPYMSQLGNLNQASTTFAEEIARQQQEAQRRAMQEMLMNQQYAAALMQQPSVEAVKPKTNPDERLLVLLTEE